MHLTIINGILVSPFWISHRGKSITLESMIIDTGSAHTWVNLDVVEDVLDVSPEEGDHIITAFGIGGRDIANRKKVEQIQFENFTAVEFQVDFGRMDADIDGLIGLDLLITGSFVINLARMEVYQER
ncbi:retropepsin-like aspartic protease [Alicyclobacillus fodiniaquatilis]|jgi:hypothetical protein|uniref:Retropepsin-like aspartic protease n=1 Tax=Alicyclobacillus fodiniaquatilis TaxID=1661150 RepID=A0ABW4JBP0_9BACL